MMQVQQHSTMWYLIIYTQVLSTTVCKLPQLLLCPLLVQIVNIQLYIAVCVKIQLIFPFFCRKKKEEENYGSETKLEKKLRSRVLVFFKATARIRGRTCWPKCCVLSAALSSLPLKWQPHSLLVQVVLFQVNIFFQPINPKYDEQFSSDLRRTICINLRKSDGNQSSYFRFIGDKIC